MVKWSQLTDISTDFNNKIIWNCRNSHDQIWIDHFDRENLVTLLIVMVKFGLTTLTMSPQIGQLVKKSWSLNLLWFPILCYISYPPREFLFKSNRRTLSDCNIFRTHEREKLIVVFSSISNWQVRFVHLLLSVAMYYIIRCLEVWNSVNGDSYIPLC